MFDDLIPTKNINNTPTKPPTSSGTGMFDDLIPTKQSFFGFTKTKLEEMKQKGIDNPNPIEGALDYGIGRAGSGLIGLTEAFGADRKSVV